MIAEREQVQSKINAIFNGKTFFSKDEVKSLYQRGFFRKAFKAL